MLKLGEPLADHLHYEDGSMMDGIKLCMVWGIAIYRVMNQKIVFDV